MSRQNLKQAGGNPWVAHGCLEGAASFATDAMQLFGPAYRATGAVDLGWRDLAGARAAARGRLRDPAVAVASRSQPERAPHGRSSASTNAIMPNRRATRTWRRVEAVESFARAFAPRQVAARCRRSAASSRTPPLRGGRLPGRRGDRSGCGPSGMHEEWRDGRRLSFFVARSAAQSPCRPARKGGARHPPPRRAHPQRPRHAPRRSDALCDLLDARRLRGAADDRQYLAPQALLGLARPLQHHPRERPAHPRRPRRRLAAPDRAVGLRHGLERLPLDLPARRPHDHRPRDRVGNRPGAAVADQRRGRSPAAS